MLVMRDILPHTDLTYQIIEKGIKEEIVLKSPAALGKAAEEKSLAFKKSSKLSSGESAAEELGEDPMYRFELELEGVVPASDLGLTFSQVQTKDSPRSDDKGNYQPVFVNAETGEYAFHFLKPFMVDAKGERSEEVTLLIKSSNNPLNSSNLKDSKGNIAEGK